MGELLTHYRTYTYRWGNSGRIAVCRLCPERLTERGGGAGLDQL